MKNKNIMNYLIIWLVSLIVFNVVVFAIPNEIMGITRFDSTIFWVSYFLILLTFVGQLLTTIYVMKTATTKEKLFYKIPIFRMGIVVLTTSIILGLIFMIITKIPTWIGIIVCALALLAYIIYGVSACAVSSKIEQVNSDTKLSVAFFKEITTTAEALVACARSETAIKESKRVYELLRYSDYVSNNQLQNYEKEITQTFELFSKAIKDNDERNITLYSNNLALILKERNTKAKLTK